METTNNVMNNTLYDKYVQEQSVMYWIRNVVANRMSINGEDWSKYFQKYNSGTSVYYNFYLIYYKLVIIINI